MVDISKRHFLRDTAYYMFAISSTAGLGSILNSCANIGFNETSPILYPKLKGSKIQAPASGCYIGFYNGDMSYYNLKLGILPKFRNVPFNILRDRPILPRTYIVNNISSFDVLPFVYLTMFHSNYFGGFNNALTDKDFRNFIEQYAKDLVSFGKPIFISTMREMNDTRSPQRYKWWRPWKGTNAKPKYSIKVWRYIWQIFEDNGANKYATWVWSTIPTENTKGKLPHSKFYYPGDKYVDWIGLSVYSDAEKYWTDRPFRYLAGNTYRSMRKNFPEKPIMICEVGRTAGPSQAKWIKTTYETIKSWPGIKAVLYWDNRDWIVKLTDESYKELATIFKDDYFIGVHKYP